MEILKLYLAARKRVLDFFGCEDEGQALYDATDKHWFALSNYIIYSDEQLTKELVKEGRVYCNELRNKYTAGGYVLVDELPGGLFVFDQKKQCHDKAIIDLWRECW